MVSGRWEDKWAVGLMTGTALDGNIDVALLQTDGQQIVHSGNYALAPYQPQTMELLKQCHQQALDWQFRGAEPALFAVAEKQIALEQSTAVADLLQTAGLSHGDVQVIGFHGQTVLHHPPSANNPGQTRQLGDGALMAATLGIPVVNDFRSADMTGGGHGAPLSAIYHQALLSQLGAAAETVVLNLGGVANITWWDGADQLVAFDAGPANAPLNDFVEHMGAGSYDENGKFALAGGVDEHRLSQLLTHEYFDLAYPKSLDRCDFSWSMASGCSLSDGCALLTAFCAAAVNKALEQLPQVPKQIIVCGGGRHNVAMMQALETRTAKRVLSAEALGWRGDAIEAECFAYLAMRTMAGLPSSFPVTTGVDAPTIAGVIHTPAGYSEPMGG